MTWLDEIREREQAATKGPWHYFYEGSGSHSVFQTGGDREIVSCETGWGLTVKSNIIWEQAASDCRFVAESRQDIPNLLAYIDVLEKALKQAKKVNKQEADRLQELQDEGHDALYQCVSYSYQTMLGVDILLEKALSWRPE